MSKGYYVGGNYGPVTRSICVTSGKGGVGKTTIAANMAYHLGQRGYKVLVFDGDVGMANVDIMFGVRPNQNIYNVLNGECTLANILLQVAPNVTLVPGGSGIRELQNLNAFQRRAILDEVSRLDRTYDYLIVDTAPGISDNVLYLAAATQSVNVIITPDPASFADSYALIKVLNKTHKIQNFSIICNQVDSEREGVGMYKRFQEVAAKFLSVSLNYAGTIPIDNNLRKANHDQRLILRQYPQSIASLAIRSLVHEVEKEESLGEAKGGIEFFWEQMIGVA